MDQLLIVKNFFCRQQKGRVRIFLSRVYSWHRVTISKNHHSVSDLSYFVVTNLGNIFHHEVKVTYKIPQVLSAAIFHFLLPKKFLGSREILKFFFKDQCLDLYMNYEKIISIQILVHKTSGEVL